MKRYLLLILTTLILALAASAQRTIENPTFRAKGMSGMSLCVEKVVVQNDMTKLYMVYNHGGGFNINGESCIVAKGRELKVFSAEGIELSGPYINKQPGQQTHFVLNFPPLDDDVDRIDYIEDYCSNCFKIYDIALTKRAAAEIKSMRESEKVPANLKNYAAKIKDNGQDLDQEDFSMEPAIVKGKIYNLTPGILEKDAKVVAEVNIENPFFGRETVAAELKPDHTYEVKVPMTVRHQVAWLRLEPFYNGLVVFAAGKTIEVSVDCNEMYSLGHQAELTPYFAGENVDLNYALNLPFYHNFQSELVYNDDTLRKVATFTMLEFKKYILDGCERYCKMVDTMHITRRAKEFMKLMLKYQSAELVARSYINLPMWRNEFNVACAKPEWQNDVNGYSDCPKDLDIDHIMFFYTYDMSQVFKLWNCFGDGMMFRHREMVAGSKYYFWLNMAEEGQLPEKEKEISAAIIQKIREMDSTRTDEEFALEKKYSKTFDEFVEKEKRKVVEEWKAACGGDGFFYDFGKLSEFCSHYIPKGIPVPDSLVTEIEKMYRPFYAQYIKAKNAEILAKIESEKARGGYYKHIAGESEADSLLVELLKDCHGKVVLIDFWNTWCGPCRGAMKEMEPMKKEFEGKDVVFMYLADTSSPENEYNDFIPTVKGVHHRLPENQVDALKRKWNISGIPAYILIGKDGTVKDQKGSGVDYFRRKINEELNK